VPWDAGRLDADPRRVVVSWTGANPDADPSDPSWVGYAPEVSAEPDRVVVTIRTYRSRVPLGPQQSCTDLGFIRTLAVAATFPTAPPAGPWPPSRTCWSGSPRASARGAGARWCRPGCR
jgi:hypothetical protein